MMNSYNRSNPMIEVLSKTYFKLKEEQSYHTKNIIKQNFLLVIISVIGTIITSKLIILTAIPIYIVASIYLLKSTIKLTPLGAVEDLFNGDTYKIQNVNDEKIFELLSILMSGKGSLKIMQTVLLVLFSIINLIIFMMISFTLINYIQRLLITV